MKARQKDLHTFQVDYQSDKDDTRYLGTFTCKKMSIMDLAALGVRKAQLNGGMYYDTNNPGRGVDSETSFFNAMVAQLEICIVNSPPWWDMTKIGDPELIGTVFTEVMNYENSFLERGRNSRRNNRSMGSSQENGDSYGEEANSSRGGSEMVGDEVLAALEP